jgi:hypothetical protein
VSNVYTVTLSAEQVKRLLENLPVRDYADILVVLAKVEATPSEVVILETLLPRLLQRQAG